MKLVEVSGTKRRNTKVKIDEYRAFCSGINDFESGYKHRINIVTDEKIDSVPDSEKYFWRVEETFLSVNECTWG